MDEKACVITMLVENRPSVTSRVTGLFSGRGYNLISICGAPTHVPGVSRITIKTIATPEKLIEIKKQLNRLIDVIKLRDMTEAQRAVKREMALISVGLTKENREPLLALVMAEKAKLVSESTDSVIIEVTGTEEDVDALVHKLEPFGIRKLTRSGVLALYRELEATVTPIYSELQV